MIKSAQNKNEHFPQLQFHRKNVESEFDDVDQYDVAICLFGLHWMNDLEHTVNAIHNSLKSEGILLSLTPIEIQDLFDFRTSFVNTSTNDVNHELKKDAVARGYIAEFIDSIERNLTGNVIIHNDGSVIYTQHTFDFDGQKK